MASYTFYRGDTRAKGALGNGFQAWIPLSAAQAIALANRCDGKSKGPIATALPKTATVVFKAVADLDKAKAVCDLGSLGREIKKEKSRTTVHISTDVTQTCGGYQGNIYEIVFDDLWVTDNKGKWVKAVNPIKVSRVKPALVADTNGITDKTTVVAVAMYGVAEAAGAEETTEVAFLTSIPKANIKRVSEDAGKNWAKM